MGDVATKQPPPLSATSAVASSSRGEQAAPERTAYWLTRIVFLRGLGCIYGVAFLVSLHQSVALIGERGLLPGPVFLRQVAEQYGPRAKWEVAPTLLWLLPRPEDHLDEAVLALSWVGLLLSSLVVLRGAANMLVMAALWALYMSLVSVGQRFFGFGWESQLLETGFLAIFLCPLLSLDPLPCRLPTPQVCVWGYRWLLFRIMLGAGLIKIRGDACWRDLTCMHYFYETQPVPNPLSPHLHFLPGWWHRVETLGNHVVEVLLPWLLLLPRPLRLVGAASQLVFQAMLVSSGNLSFLNWLTMLPAIFGFDDAALAPLFSSQTVRRAWERQQEEEGRGTCSASCGLARWLLHWAVLLLLAKLSVPVVVNLLSPTQAMNTSYDPLRILNTYGAFGSVTKQRTEVVLLGTANGTVDDDSTVWEEYEFKCKPGAVDRRPCLISPYHYRLDWLAWFAAFSRYQEHPWLIHLAAKLLHGDPQARGLLATDPFAATSRPPPRFIKADHYRYRFSKRGGAYWERERMGEYFPPISLDNPSLQDFCKARGWEC